MGRQKNTILFPRITMNSGNDWCGTISSLLTSVPLSRGLRPHLLLLAVLLPPVTFIYWWHLPDATAQTDMVPPVVAAMAAADSSISVAETRKKPKPVWRNYTVARGDTLSDIFQKQGFGTSTLRQVIAASKAVAPLANLRAGDELRFRVDEKGQLLAVSHALGNLDTLVAEAGPDGWQARMRHLKPTPHTVVRDGSVDGPLLSSLRAADIPSGIAAAFVKIFHWKVDFHRDMRPGATFAVIYQQLMHNGKEVGQGPIEAAELTNAGKTLRVYRYENGKGDYGYYTAEGHSLEPFILRTPLHYTRVSSTFSRRRWHPILHIWRPHYGVDLAAPAGTPIKAAANGVVKYIGRASGYGRLIELDNRGAYSTRYGHMSRFAKGLKKGDPVHQGEVIGYVGQSGEATGPHLHFEIRVHGKPYPPLKVKLPDSAPLPKKLMADFQQTIQPLLAVLKAPDGDSSRQYLAALDEQPLTTARVSQSENKRDL